MLLYFKYLVAQNVPIMTICVHIICFWLQSFSFLSQGDFNYSIQELHTHRRILLQAALPIPRSGSYLILCMDEILF